MSVNVTADPSKKLRHAEFITPPNTLKKKVGSGGLDPRRIDAAEEKLAAVDVDFRPIAADVLEDLAIALDAARRGANGEPAIEAMICPALQLKAQGGMFKFPLISDLANRLIVFLETVPVIDADVLEVVEAYRKTFVAVIDKNMSGDGGTAGQALKDSLGEACARYYRRHTAAENAP